MIIQDLQLESLGVILPVPPSPEEKKVGEGAAASALGEPTCLSLLLDFFGEQEGRPQ